MSTEVENSAAADPSAPATAVPPPAGTAPNSAPTSPATAAGSIFKKEKKKVAEKTDEYLLARFQGDGVRYKAKLIGVDDVPEARGDKMSQDSMMKLKGMAVAARSQGKHKQRIWVNISMSGIKIIDEKSGVIEHEQIVNKISFIARDVTDNRAFGYVCGAEGQHQFFAIKTGQQAEPLVIDLKDLFQVIFNQRKKEAEASHKGENSSTVVENGSDALLSVEAGQKTAKPVEQLDLFGDMSTPPDIHSPTESNDILLLDLSSEVDSNQNCIKGNPFVTSCASSNLWASPHTENPFSSSAFGFFPTPDTDPFKDDPLSHSPGQSASHNNPHISLAAAAANQAAAALPSPPPAITKTIMNGLGDSSQLNGLSSESVILALSNGHWPLGGVISHGPKSASAEEDSCVGPAALSAQNPFLDASSSSSSVKSVALLSNGVACEPQTPVPPRGGGGKESVVISPPPQNAKAGRGRRRAQSTNNDLFGADLFAEPGLSDGSPEAVDSLFNNTPASSVASSIAALGNLQLGAAVTSAGLWGAPTSVHSMFPSMPGVGSPMTLPGPQPAFPQPSAFGGLPIPPGVWGQQMPPQFGVPPASQPQLWGQPPPQVGPMGGAPGWGQPPMANPFQPSHFPMMGEHQQGPPRPPPRPPVKEAPPKVENSAFTALDPLGEKEKKMGKDMFKDFQIAKPPPAIPARKGEAPSTNGGGAFDQYFSNKVGLPQDVADHDDFDINQMSAVVNDAPAAVLAPSLAPGLLDDAFSLAPAAAPAPSQGFNQSIFDEAFGAPPIAMSPPAVQTSVSSDPFGDPFGNPFA